jgi:hypothetical protein
MRLLGVFQSIKLVNFLSVDEADRSFFSVDVARWSLLLVDEASRSFFMMKLIVAFSQLM